MTVHTQYIALPDLNYIGYCAVPARGGGGVLGIYIVGGVRGVLGAGTTKKRGSWTRLQPEKGEFRTDFVKKEGVRN